MLENNSPNLNLAFKFVSRVFVCFIITGGIFMAAVIYNPELLKPLIKTGIPLNNLSNLPVLGDVIRAANTPQITVQELKTLIDNKDTNFVLVDVRSPEEYEYIHIPGAILVPLTDIQQGTGIKRIQLLMTGHKLITYCSVGQRSNKALELLKNAGIKGLNLRGGIHEWRKEIDPSMPEI